MEVGRRRRGLLDMLRMRDGLVIDDDDATATTTATASTCELYELERDMTNMLTSTNRRMRRRGLFDGDASRAYDVHRRAMEISSNASRIGGGGDDDDGRKTKRKRRGGNNGGGGVGGGGEGRSSSSSFAASSYGIRLDAHDEYYDDGDESGRHVDAQRLQDDERSILTAICMILGACVRRRERRMRHGGGGDASSTTSRKRYSHALVISSLDVLRSICDHARDASSAHPSSCGGDGNADVATTCAHVEMDMMRSVGPYLLDALHDNVRHFSSICRNNAHRRRLENHDDDDDIDYDVASRGLMASLASCASLLSILGYTGMSRHRSSRGTIRELRDATWSVLLGEFGDGGCRHDRSGGKDDDDDDCDDDDDVVVVGVRRAAIALLASLPLVGTCDDAGATNASSSSSSSSPSEVWSRSVHDGVALMRWAIDDFFPVSARGSSGGGNGGGATGGGGGSGSNASDPSINSSRGDHVEWTAYAKDGPSSSSALRGDGDDDVIDLDGVDPTDRHRSRALLGRIRCLAMYLRSLLVMEGYPPDFTSNGIVLPLDSLLDVAEILLTFPLAAEARYRATKSRLRSTPVDGGLISPNGAMSISNRVRSCGHGLIDVVLESCRGGYGVLGRARRIVGMVVANLRYSCSDALIAAVEGNGRRGGRHNGIEVGGNGMASSRSVAVAGCRPRGSIPLRTKSVATFHVAAVSLGCGVMSSTCTSKSVSRALVLLGGCLLEQVRGVGNVVESGRGIVNAVDDEWGTLGEKARLVEASSNALAACIASFGALIPNNVRGTLDSITQTCLTTLYSHGCGSIFAYSHVKRALLRLGTNCICVPWGDGGRCAISDVVRTTAASLRRDPDVTVASAALSTLCVFDAFATPRAPPMQIITRVDRAGDAGELTASALIQGISESRKEIAASRETQDGRMTTKSDRKSNKRAKIEKAKKDATNADAQSQSDPKRVDRGDANAYSESKIESTPGGKSDKSVDRDESYLVTQSLPSDTIDTAEKMVEDGTCEHHNERQNIMSDQRTDGMNASNDVDGRAEEKGQENEEEDSDDSMEDFPDIVDEDPDDEDKL